MEPVVIVRHIRKPLKEAQLKQIVNAWNRMIDAKAGNPWWKKVNLKSKSEDHHKLMSGNEFLYVIFNRQKKPIGEINGGWINKKTAGIGYWLDPACCGKGYMAAALKKVLNALKIKGCRKALFSTRETNKKSISLLQRIGAEYKEKEVRKRIGRIWKYNKYELLLK